MAVAASFAARHYHGHLAAGLVSAPQASGSTSRSGVTISMRAQVEARPGQPTPLFFPFSSPPRQLTEFLLLCCFNYL
jgi:hypothetical protein